MQSVIAQWHGKKYRANVNEYGVAVIRGKEPGDPVSTAEQLADAERILADPVNHGGPDSDLSIWAQEVLRLYGETNSRSVGRLEETKLA